MLGIARAAKVTPSGLTFLLGIGKYAAALAASCAQVRGSSRNRSIHSASAADASMLMRAISESEMRLAPGERARGQSGLQRSARTAKYYSHRSATAAAAAASTSIVT